MKIVYDPEVDASSIVFQDTTVTMERLGPGIAANYDGQREKEARNGRQRQEG